MERRKLKRWHLVYYLRVFGHNSEKPVGHLVDISAEGIMLISERPIEVGLVFRFKMSLPAVIDGTREVELSAESKWCKRDSNPDFYNTGFELKDIRKEDIKIIESLISKFNIDKTGNSNS